MLDALKISTAAKAWLALLGLLAQVGLSYFPDHGNVWYNATQALVAVLGVIGVYAIPNRERTVADLKQAADDVAAIVAPALAPAPAIDASVTVPAAPAVQPADVPAAEPAVATQDTTPPEPAVGAQDDAPPVPAQ